jgi:hypothetical protein
MGSVNEYAESLSNIDEVGFPITLVTESIEQLSLGYISTCKPLAKSILQSNVVGTAFIAYEAVKAYEEVIEDVIKPISFTNIDKELLAKAISLNLEDW